MHTHNSWITAATVTIYVLIGFTALRLVALHAQNNSNELVQDFGKALWFQT